ncbi:nucleolar protein 12-domain-containing protein [Mycotypha africana]|uniref:nucleolar protein 12-domain-containing protein n=1 Tax=Mycotypha africana TaxID=64632 RepID=UPI0023018569|nr:nucleolar protein 12-domain-containing protein [Mycotypha africana]KAI8987982.1 nucleolar protein 12-domain-containing protein [Mycotypha africana]
MKAKYNKKPKNSDILSAGSRIYAKKRKAKKDIVESVEFDEASRKEFLTGFHKRKLERKARTKEKYARLAKEEKIQARKEAREERKRLANKNVEEMAALLRSNIDNDEETLGFEDEDDEENGDEKKKKAPKVQEFKNKSMLTTVTVIEDLDLEEQ